MPYNVLDPSTAANAPDTDAGAPSDEGINLAQMKEDIILTLGNRTDVATGGALETNLLRWINYGYVSVCQMLDLKELWGSVEFNLVAGQPFYAVPPSLAWVKRMALQDETDYWLTGGTEMAQIDEPTYRTLPDSTQVQSLGTPLPPSQFFRFRRMIVVYPTPQDDYTAVVDFRVRPIFLEEDDECPLLPTEFHEVVMLAGLERAQRILGLRNEALLTMNDKLAVLRPLLNTDAEEAQGMHMAAQPIRRTSQLYRRSFRGED